MSLAQLLGVDKAAEEVGDEDAAESLEELVGDVYDPTEEFR
jgi:hypothetical protein